MTDHNKSATFKANKYIKLAKIFTRLSKKIDGVRGRVSNLQYQVNKTDLLSTLYINVKIILDPLDVTDFIK